MIQTYIHADILALGALFALLQLLIGGPLLILWAWARMREARRLDRHAEAMARGYRFDE